LCRELGSVENGVGVRQAHHQTRPSAQLRRSGIDRYLAHKAPYVTGRSISADHAGSVNRAANVTDNDE
jgi:hypothetical protein